MADFTALKTAIQTYIKENGNEEITGEKLQEILLSVVTTLGDSAINDLVTALANEVAARQNADGTLQQNITNEATARGNADTALGGRIDDEETARASGDTALSNRLGSTITSENTAADQIGAEAEARAAADIALLDLIDGITDNIENGYVYAGIATPSSTPATGKVFYLALTAGTYTNFGSTVVSQGINILKYNGSAWSLDAFIGIDDVPTPSSTGIPKSGGTFDFVMKNGSAFDISAHFASGGTLASYADLSAALAALDTLPAAYKRGGMVIRYVDSSDDKYVQYRLMSTAWSNTISDWQGIAVADDFKNPDETKRAKITTVGAVSEIFGSLEEDIEFSEVKIGSDGKIYWAIKKDGDIYFGCGVPSQIKKYVQRFGLNIEKTIVDVANTKVDKVAGKGLSSNDYDNTAKAIVDMDALINSQLYSFALTGSNNELIMYVDKSGKTTISENNNYDKYKNCTSKQRLIGALVWDGGSPSAFGDMQIAEEISNEQYIASEMYDEEYPTWREYVKHIYGKYPPKMCTFATFFNTNPEIEPSRQPITSIFSETVGDNVSLGWWFSGYTDKETGELYETEKVEAQIDLASNYGLDYFSISLYFTPSMFNDDGSVNELNVKTRDENNFIYQFLASRNKWKMKFCLLLFMQTLDKKQTYKMMEYINNTFFNDSSYLYVNGSPLIMCLDVNRELQNYSFARFKGCNMIINGFNNVLDGAFSYGFSATASELEYNTFASNHLISWKNYTIRQGIYVFPVSCGRDDRGRYGYTRNVNRTTKPTEEEFYNALIETIRLAYKRCAGDILVSIYSWCEFIEGGWICPTQAEIDNNEGYYKLHAIQRAKRFLLNNY